MSGIKFFSNKYYGDLDSEGNNVIPQEPVVEEPILDYVPPNPAGYNSIPAAGLRGQQVSDVGGTPMFTNVVQDVANPSVNPAEVVRLTQGAMSNGKVPQKPDEHAVAFANQIESFQKHIIDTMWNGNDLRTESSASPQQQAQAQADMNFYLKMFSEELSGGKGSLVKTVDANGKVTWESKKNAEGKQAPQGNTGVDATKTFTNWKPEEKESAFKSKILTKEEPKFSNRDSSSRNDFANEFNQWINKNGLTPQKVAAVQAEYKGLSSAISNMEKQEAPMNAFVLNINKQVNKLSELFAEADRTGFRLIDLPIRELKVKAGGSGKEAVLASYLLEVSNEIGKLSSGASASVQQLSDSAKEDWKKVHDVNLSPKEIMYVLNATKDQANMRMTTWIESRNNLYTRIANLIPSSNNKEPSPQQAQNAPTNKIDMTQVVESRVSKSGKKLYKLKDGSIVSE